jgi:hypothetical protein
VNDYPVFDADETASRLRESLRSVEWAASLIPEAYTRAMPDFAAPDEWHAAMNLAHLVVYEEEISYPVLKHLAEGGDGVGATKSAIEQWFYNDAVALSSQPMGELVRRLSDVREKQIVLIEVCAPERLNERVTPLFGTGRHGTGPHSLGWVATKTFQHTWEHGNALLRLALFAPR